MSTTGAQAPAPARRGWLSVAALVLVVVLVLGVVLWRVSRPRDAPRR